MDFIHAQLYHLQKHFYFVQTEAIDWTFYVQALSWSIVLFEAYISIRQLPYFSIKEPPPAIKEHFQSDEFENSQKYGKDTAKFLLAIGLYAQMIQSAKLYLGLYPWAWDFAGAIIERRGYNISESQLLQSILFSYVVAFPGMLLQVPLLAYRTFVIEEKHGFNKTTPRMFLTDQVKAWVIGLVINGASTGAVVSIMEWAGDRLVPWLAVFSVAVHLIFSLLVPSVIQPLFNKLTPLEEGEVKTRTQSLAAKLDFPLSRIYEIDGSKRSSHSNAYFFGSPWNKHIVLYDTLIQQSKPDEVEAILAHELGHWYFMHAAKFMVLIQSQLALLYAIIPAFLNAPPVLLSFGFSPSIANSPPPYIAFTLFWIISAPIFKLSLFSIKVLSRRFEFEADRFVVDMEERVSSTQGAKAAEGLADLGESLQRALISVNIKNKSMVWVDWMYSAYHHTHPTLGERLEALKRHQATKAKKTT